MRLIDADELDETLSAIADEHASRRRLDVANRYYFVLAVLMATPTIDAVPVVRCKDCKYWQDNNGGYPHGECRWGKGETPDPDDFCSYGERKGGDA